MDRIRHKSYDPEVPLSREYPETCLPLILEQNARLVPGSIAADFFGNRLIYRQLWDHVLWLGAIVIMTNPLYVERELFHQWTNSGAEILFILDHLYPKAEKVLPQTGIRTTIATSVKDYLPLPLRYLYPVRAYFKKPFTSVPYDGTHVFSLKETIHDNRPDPIPCAAHPDCPALLQYTGGTTGVPKGAMLTHRNIRKKRPTIFPGVPAIYIALMAHPKADSFDLSSIRFRVTGSAPMPVEVMRRFEQKTGSKIVEGYGLSEASPVTHANPIEGTLKPGSIGIALPDTDCRIVDPETGTMEMPAGRVGELIVRGPQVMRGYWKDGSI